MCYLQETHFNFNEHHQIKAKEWKKIVPASRNQNRAKEAKLVSDKINFNPKTVTKRQRRSLCNENRVSHQEAITIINIYVPNTEVPKYANQILMELKG